MLRRAFETCDTLEISIQGGWRGKLLAKEVGLLLPVNAPGLIEKGPMERALELVWNVYDALVHSRLHGHIS
jgi:hypothetical protein